MEHLPWVKPKSERYFRSQSATDYGLDTIKIVVPPRLLLAKMQRQFSNVFNINSFTLLDTIKIVVSQFESVERPATLYDSFKLRELTEHLQEKHKRLEENQKRWEKSTRQLEENQKRLRKSTKQLEENQKRLRKSTKQLEENQQRLEESTRQLEKNQQRLKEIQKRSKISTKQSKTSTKQLRKSIKQLEENRKRLKENQKRMRKSIKQIEEKDKRLEESTWQLEENKKRLEDPKRQLEENRKRIEENQKRMRKSKEQLEESTRQLEEIDKRLEEPRRQSEEFIKELRISIKQKSTWQLEENKKRLEENKTRLEESARQLEESRKRLEENQKRLQKSTWQLEESTWQLQKSTWQLEESTWQLEESSWQLEESTWQLEGNKTRFEGNKQRLEESTQQIEEIEKRLEESTRQLEELTQQIEKIEKRLEESTRQFEGNKQRTKTSTKQEGTCSLVQPHQELIAPKYKPRPQLTTSWILSRALIMMQLVGVCCGATGNPDCLKTQSVLLGSQEIIRCRLLENSTRFFWYDTNNEGGDTLLIKLENGRVSGTGYTTGEFNIDSDGSLVINSVKVQHERVFHFESVSPNLIRSKDITVIVYVEPIEPIPVITECLGKSDCIMKGNLDGVISCVHHNTRPAATISWFMRDGTHDIPLNSTTNQTLSSDLITFTVTSEMAIGEIPLLVYKKSLVLLLCKSHNPYSVVQESDSKVLLDLSQNYHFEKQPDPVYAIQNQELVIECPLPTAAEDSIVMWIAKSLETKNSVYLKYSAYGVVPSVETDEQLSLDKSGDLVISKVGLQHEGLYACVKNAGNITKSFLQRVEVIVQPIPPKVLVEGCNLFEPCSFHITETKTITCKVNGVHPEVELNIKVMSTNLAVINTKVFTYEKEGLFYTSIHGEVILVDTSCQVNGTIICQAVGLAANVFKSDAFISISSNGVKCPQISAAPFPADKEVQINHPWLIICLIIAITLLYVIIAFIVIRKCFAKLICHRYMQAEEVMEINSV